MLPSFTNGNPRHRILAEPLPGRKDSSFAQKNSNIESNTSKARQPHGAYCIAMFIMAVLLYYSVGEGTFGAFRK